MIRTQPAPVSLPLTDQIAITGSSLSLPEGLSYDQWLSVGRKLMLADKAVQWAIGDWWVYGDHRYGERAAAAIDPDTGENRLQRYMDYGFVARAIETSRRREVLSWSAHREVAALEPKIQDAILDRAVENGWGSREVRAAVKEFKNRMAGGNAPRLSAQTPVEDAEIVEEDDKPVMDATPTGAAIAAESRREVLDAYADQRLSSANQRLLKVLGDLKAMRADPDFLKALDAEGLNHDAIRIEGQWLINVAGEVSALQSINWNRKSAPKAAISEAGARGEGDGLPGPRTPDHQDFDPIRDMPECLRQV